ncbi:hypothetical protein B0T09DRAFT_380169 [Sordaria sp. MPI-SDFR-AT-0083]|nr:hypothetical protein B0T09DRAFT_380169 [Sordaria sp. MPI-SDFR-AT-0083]
MPPSRLRMRDDVQLRPDNFLNLPYYPTIARNKTHEVLFTSITNGLDLISNTTSASGLSQKYITPWTKQLIPGSCQTSHSVDPITSSNNPGAPLNCSQACVDISLLFGSLATLANCITLSSAALTIQNRSLSLGPPTNSTALAQFGVTSADLTNFNGDAMLRGEVQCAVASCPDCSQNELSALHNRNLSTLGSDDFSIISAGLAHYCEGFVARIDSDVAGPGVLISHLSQSYLTLFFFLLIKLFNS